MGTVERPFQAASRSLALSFLLAFACGRAQEPSDAPADERHPGDPPTALRQTLEELRESAAAERHPSDGGGRAWLEEADRGPVAVGSRHTWTIVYEAGPLGIEVGGAVRLIVSPFWDWSPPQNRVPQAPGYTTAECLAEGVELEVDVPQWFEVKIQGRPLAAGEQLRIVYGAGEAQAKSDTYAEKDSRFWVGVDGDGDGIHRVLADSPSIEVLPGPPRRLQLTLPSTAAPMEEVPLGIAVLDAFGNRGVPFQGEVEIVAVPETVEWATPVRLTADMEGLIAITVRPTEQGVVRMVARLVGDGDQGPVEIVGESNPCLVAEATPRVLWGDLHGHSNLSDGTGTPEDYFVYARDVARLDVVSLTDHDHWGMLFLDEDPQMWEQIRSTTARFNDPGRFVTLLGYEWTSWIHGHRHVLYFGDDGPVLSSIDPAYETPTQLWDALRGSDALTFAHHSAGGPVATNWDFPPDPELEPVTEVASVHGNSEAMDAPSPIYSPLQGNFVRDVLERGYPLGFIGSGDSHDGHPGLVHLAGGKGGLAAILSEDLTREGVRQALQRRRVYATNGPRIVLRCALDGQGMGLSIPKAELENPSLLYVRAIACAPIERIDIIRSGGEIQSIGGEQAWDFTTAVELEGLEAGDFVYVRAIQTDGGCAWSSPFFITD